MSAAATGTEMGYDTYTSRANGPVEGRVHIPGSKSVTHRTFLLAAQSATPCTVTGALLGADTGATLRCLLDMGADARIDDRDTGTLTFHPATLRVAPGPLDCQNAGTGLRLLAGTVARFAGASILTGDQSLRSRPNDPLIAALRAGGAVVDSRDGRAPLRITGPLRPGRYDLPPAISSQYASALLLSLPMLPGSSEVHMAGPVHSAPYLDLTRDAAAAFGIHFTRRDGDDGGLVFDVPGGQRPSATHHAIEGDWSTAAFPLVAAAITGGTVTATGLRRDSRQGDAAIAAHLTAFGCTVEWLDDDHALRVTGPDPAAGGAGLTSPGTIDVAATPDAFPALCVLAAVASGTTTFVGGGQLRIKESDRIATMAAGLAACGVAVTERPDGAVVVGCGGPVPGPAPSVVLAAHHDHRIHMALTILGLAAKRPVTVDGAASAAVSYPNFHQHLARLTKQEVPA